MKKQLGFADAFADARLGSNRKLSEIDELIDWSVLERLVQQMRPGTQGRPPFAALAMLKALYLQRLYDLSDPGLEEALADRFSFRRFCGFSLADPTPDETTILRFRHLLEKHNLTEAMFQQINGELEQKGLLLRSGTIVDATMIAAPSSTKNSTKSRDPEMRQTKKGNMWHFGMKVHVGTDRRGVVHSLVTTHAAAADIKHMDALLHGEEKEIFGDQAYWKEADRLRFRSKGVKYRVNRRGNHHRPLTEYQKKINTSRSRTRARGEHAFRVVKRLWGFAKVRYRGLMKNTARAFATFAMANLYMVRKFIVPDREKCLC